MSLLRRGRSSRPSHLLRPTLGLLATLAVLAAPPSAAAHAALVTIAPADKSSGPAPTAIVGTFAQNLDPAKSSFTVVDAGGTVVAKGGEVGSDPRAMTLALTSPLAPGAYTVRWTTVSTEDGETARGTTSFTVVAAPSPSASPSPSPTLPPSATPAASGTPSPSLPPVPSASATPASPAASTADAVVPIVAALIVLAAIGLWLLRGRGRTVR